MFPINVASEHGRNDSSDQTTLLHVREKLKQCIIGEVLCHHCRCIVLRLFVGMTCKHKPQGVQFDPPLLSIFARLSKAHVQHMSVSQTSAPPPHTSLKYVPGFHSHLAFLVSLCKCKRSSYGEKRACAQIHRNQRKKKSWSAASGHTSLHRLPLMSALFGTSFQDKRQRKFRMASSSRYCSET